MNEFSEDDAPIIRIAYTIIKEAIVDGATEISIEPGRSTATPLEGVEAALRALAESSRRSYPEVLWLKVSYKTREEWHEVMPLPEYVREPLTRRFKLMADLDLAIKHEPQSGRIPIRYEDRDCSVFVETLPDALGEQLLMRITSP